MLVGIVAIGALGLGACGDGDGGEGDAAAASGEGGGGRRTSDTEPEATDAEVVRPYIEELLEEHDRVVNQITADPGVAADRESLLAREYLDLYEPGSDFAEDLLDGWAADAEEGISIRPYSDEHPASVTRLDGEIEVVSPDEVRVPVCVERRQITYRGDQPIQGLPLLERPGESVVVRIEGEWLLRDRILFGDRSGCGGEAS